MSTKKNMILVQLPTTNQGLLPTAKIHMKASMYHISSNIQELRFLIYVYHVSQKKCSLASSVPFVLRKIFSGTPCKFILRAYFLSTDLNAHLEFSS